MRENELIKWLDMMICEMESTRDEVLRIRQILKDKKWEIINTQENDLEKQSKTE